VPPAGTFKNKNNLYHKPGVTSILIKIIDNKNEKKKIKISIFLLDNLNIKNYNIIT
jgi:hypothetical protein